MQEGRKHVIFESAPQSGFYSFNSTSTPFYDCIREWLTQANCSHVNNEVKSLFQDSLFLDYFFKMKAVGEISSPFNTWVGTVQSAMTYLKLPHCAKRQVCVKLQLLTDDFNMIISIAHKLYICALLEASRVKDREGLKHRTGLLEPII